MNFQLIPSPPSSYEHFLVAERKACKAWVRVINQFKNGTLRSGTGSLLGSDPLDECIAEARRHLAETARILKHEYPSFTV